MNHIHLSKQELTKLLKVYKDKGDVVQIRQPDGTFETVRIKAIEDTLVHLEMIDPKTLEPTGFMHIPLGFVLEVRMFFNVNAPRHRLEQAFQGDAAQKP